MSCQAVSACYDTHRIVGYFTRNTPTGRLLIKPRPQSRNFCTLFFGLTYKKFTLDYHFLASHTNSFDIQSLEIKQHILLKSIMYAL